MHENCIYIHIFSFPSLPSPGSRSPLSQISLAHSLVSLCTIDLFVYVYQNRLYNCFLLYMYSEKYIFMFAMKRNYANFAIAYKYEFCVCYMWKLLFLQTHLKTKIMGPCTTLQQPNLSTISIPTNLLFLQPISKFLPAHSFNNPTQPKILFTKEPNVLSNTQRSKGKF